MQRTSQEVEARVRVVGQVIRAVVHRAADVTKLDRHNQARDEPHKYKERSHDKLEEGCR